MMTLRATVIGVMGVLATVSSASADEATATVSGTVKVDNQALAGGRIFFYLEEDEFVGSKIKDGSYKVSRLPAGVWKVAIEGEGVPARFATEKTPLTVTVKAGVRNTFDFSLTSR